MWLFCNNWWLKKKLNKLKKGLLIQISLLNSRNGSNYHNNQLGFLDMISQKVNQFTTTSSIKKTIALATTFFKPVGEENPHVWFEESPQIISNQTWGKVSVSMNADPINEKYRSKINKTSIVLWAQKMFYINKSNQFIRTIMNTQPEPLPQTSSSLRGNQISIYSLHISHRHFSTTPEEKYQDQ